MNRSPADNHQPLLGRRSFLRLSAAVTAGALMRPSFARAATNKSYPALGTYPQGVSGDTAFIGITVPLTGPYAPGGNDELRGYKLAIEHLNNGGGLVDKMSTLSGKGVLGKRLAYKVGDSETKPNSAVQAATAFIRDHNAIMITGCISSSVAIALGKLGAREHVIYMGGGSASNDVTGKDCSRYGFRSQICYAYPIGKALAPVLAKQMGKNRKAVYLVPDYTYGHTVFDSVSQFVGEQGWQTAGKVLYPLGTSDFSSYLLNIANTDAEVFINIAYGNDAVNSIKQAKQFGILGKMKLVVPNISAFMAKSLGPEYVEGVYGAMDFWWSMAETVDNAKRFVDAFDKANGYKPRVGAEFGYTQMLAWADAVERAGTFYPPEVIKTLEAGHKIAMPCGEGYYRACDHQMVHPMPVVVGKGAAQMKGPEDFYDVVEIVSGEGILPSCDALGCKLGPYT